MIFRVRVVGMSMVFICLAAWGQQSEQNTPAQQSEPTASLKETVDWLRGKLDFNNGPDDFLRLSMPSRCTLQQAGGSNVSFHPNCKVTWTIPLGSIDLDKSQPLLPFGLGGPDARYGIVIALRGLNEQKVMRIQVQGPGCDKDSEETRDEGALMGPALKAAAAKELADRVVKAINHAATLCGASKEPF